MPRDTPRVPLPYAPNFCAGAKPWGNTQRTNPGIVFPTYLTTKGSGGQKLGRHENAILLSGQNADLTTATAQQPC